MYNNINVQNYGVKINPITFKGKEKFIQATRNIGTNPKEEIIQATQNIGTNLKEVLTTMGVIGGASGVALVNMQKNKATVNENNIDSKKITTEEIYKSPYNFPDAKNYADVIARINKSEIEEVDKRNDVMYITFKDNNERGWFPNGQLRYEAVNHHREVRHWYQNGNLQLELLPNGFKKEYYENGQIKKENLGFDGSKREWFENGQIKEEKIPDVSYTTWDEKGIIKRFVDLQEKCVEEHNIGNMSLKLLSNARVLICNNEGNIIFKTGKIPTEHTITNIERDNLNRPQKITFDHPDTEEIDVSIDYKKGEIHINHIADDGYGNWRACYDNDTTVLQDGSIIE